MSHWTVLVCGGRDFKDAALVDAKLDALHAESPILFIVHGDAPGADRLAKRWAFANGVSEKRYHPAWKLYGKQAGPIRNQLMLDDAKPDLVVALPGGKGTAHMVRIAREAGVPVIEVGSVIPVESSSFGEPK